MKRQERIYIGRLLMVLMASLMGRMSLQAQLPVPFDQANVRNGQYFKNGVPITGTIFKLRSEDKSTELELDVVNGIPQGKYNENYPGGTPKKQAFYNQGKLDGEYKEYGENGKLIHRTTYSHGVLDGLDEQFHADGQPRIALSYRNGQIVDGEYRETNDNGQIVLETTYQSGKIARRTPYLNGAIDGTVTTFYANGETSSTCPYDKGMPSGTKKEFDQNGHLQRTTTFVAGLRQGPTVSFNTTGDTLRTDHYVNDSLAAYDLYTYYGDGKRQVKEGYGTDGQKQGASYTYWSNGELRRSSLFEHGRETRVLVENENDPAKSLAVLYKGGDMEVVEAPRHPLRSPCIVLVRADYQSTDRIQVALKTILFNALGSGRLMKVDHPDLRQQPDYRITLSELQLSVHYDDGHDEHGNVTSLLKGYRAKASWIVTRENMRTGTRVQYSSNVKGHMRPDQQSAVKKALTDADMEARTIAIHLFPLEGHVVRVEKLSASVVKSIIVDLGILDGVDRKTLLDIKLRNTDGTLMHIGQAKIKEVFNDGTSQCSIEEGGNVLLPLIGDLSSIIIQTQGVE